MRFRNLYIQCLFSCIAMLLFLSCGGNDGNSDPVVPSEQPRLQVTIFTAGHPVITRADEGYVSGTDDEEEIHKLQVWVFEHHEGDTEEERANDGKKVAYLEDLHPMSQLHHNMDGDILEGTYQLVVSNSFAEAKPNVDVFVLANGNQDGLPVLDGNTTRAQLQDALMKKTESADPYGLTTLVTEVPTESGVESYGGLPMSGRLNNVKLEGQSPVLNVNKNNPVTVVRTVSKVRFIFSRKTRTNEDNSEIRITRIELNGGIIPKEEYIFLEEPYTPRAYRVGNSYESAKVLAKPGDMEIEECDTPSKYAYVSQGGLDYEKMIDEGLKGINGDPNKKELSQLGLFYFRESDKPLTGKIHYEIRNGTEVEGKDADFSMREKNAGDFSRNHTWIVYGYFAGSDNLEVVSVKINPWVDLKVDDEDHEVYNW